MANGVFKLMNGDEIIAHIDQMDEEKVVLSNPVQIHRVHTPYGTEMIKCSYWLLFNKSPTVTIDRYNVLTYAEDISEKVIRHYEFFLQHAVPEIGHDIEQPTGQERKAVEAIEKEYRKKMQHIQKQEEELFDLEEELQDSTHFPANTTIH
jgi:hypothetical protein|tara:strand:+ start:2120 stop:2569 length:450 start_codon:yes stop_codon:yes gene_type:complete